MTVAPTISIAISNDTTPLLTTILRPTEAQLRYAQFHHKRRAQTVKDRIDRLHQTPQEVTTTTNSDDDNNNNKDDHSSDNNSRSGTDTSDVELHAIRLKRRPVISVGRRALLKDSKRRFRRRRKDVSKHGYRGGFMDDEIEDVVPRSAMAAAATSDDEDDDDDDDDDDNDEENAALNEIFMTRPKKQRRGRGQRHHHPHRRANSAFQAACHAMMKNIQTSQTNAAAPSIVVSSKRWKRSEEHVAAAAAQQDFDKYKTSGMGRSKQKYGSARSASLLLSYAYHQQNQKHHTMDRGATWLTHLPRKQSKGRNNPNNFYYFHDLTGLPPLSNDNGIDDDYSGDGNESSITLSMRKPGPQKFHRLMEYVQQRLIEKEKQQQQQIDIQTYDGENNSNNNNVNSPGRRRTGEISESIESIQRNIMNSSNNEHNNTDNRVQQLRKSLEGTPTMILQNNTPFSGSSSESQQRRRGRSRYVPRMRLREFTGNSGLVDDETGTIPTTTPLPRKKLIDRFQVDGQIDDDLDVEKNESSSQPPKMRLREFSIGQEQIEVPTTNESNLRSSSGGDRGSSRAKEMALAFEDNNNIKGISQSEEIPRMKLKDDLVYHKEIDGKDATGFISRTNTDGLSEQFEDTHISSSEDNENYSSYDATHQGIVIDSNKRGSNVSDFFAQVRSDTDEQQQNHQNSLGNDSRLSSSTIGSHPRRVSSDTLSDVSGGSNLSGLWNRGRNSISTLTTNLNTIAENQTSKGKALLPPEIIGRASDVSDRVSGFFNKIRGVQEDISEGTTTQDQQFNPPQEKSLHSLEYDQNDSSPRKLMPSPSVDSHDALRAYRKNRESLSPEYDDQISLASSFHALPDQIREVVQNSGSSPAEANTDNERYLSPSRTTITQSTMSDLSAEQYRRAHGRFLQNSALLGGEFEHESVIDTDDTQSDATGAADMDPQTLANLMMSPDILQKRLKQAISAVEQRKWDQVLFLINANPWLAEMKELTTNQYLLHKLAFFGSDRYGTPAPMSLSERLVEKFPAAVYKFDQDGNVPLHLAAAAGSLKMIQMLGEKFESGASIRNEDGMLPLHFTIASFADSVDQNENKDDDINSQPLGIIKMVMKLFPKAVAISDNDGNLPLHVAAECLHGGTGVDVVYLLMDEADRQLQDPLGARFRNKTKLEEIVDEDMSTATMSTERDVDSSVVDTEMHCSMVLNDFNETPLLAAIRSRKGWEMIEAILTGPGGRRAALNQDADSNNALHLLVGEFQDATAAMVSYIGAQNFCSIKLCTLLFTSHIFQILHYNVIGLQLFNWILVYFENRTRICSVSK